MSFIGVPVIGPRPPSASACRARVRQQRHLAGVLDRRRDVALVLSAVAGNPSRPDLAAVRDELAQQPDVLVVDVGDLLLAEQADFLLRLANRWLGHRGAPWQSPARAGMVVSSGRIGLAGWPRASGLGPAGCRLAGRGPADLSWPGRSRTADAAGPAAGPSAGDRSERRLVGKPAVAR